MRAWHHTYGLPVLTTNCSNNYGPYHFPEKLIPLMIVNALAGKPLPVYGDGQQVRDWLYVEDHCAAIRAVLGARPGRRDLQRRRLEREAEHRGRAHASARSSTSCGRAPTARYARLITYVTDRPGHDRRYAIDARKIERELGWRPAETFETGIRKTVRWYLDNAGLGRAACRAAPTATGCRRNYEQRRHEDPAARQERPGRLGAAARRWRRSATWSRSTSTARRPGGRLRRPDALRGAGARASRRT